MRIQKGGGTGDGLPLSPLGEGVGCIPLGTKVPIYHFKAESVLNMMHDVVNLLTCAVICKHANREIR